MSIAGHCIGILVTHSAERRRLEACLSTASYTVKAGDPELLLAGGWEGCSAIIVDAHAARAHREQLLALREARRPAKLPLLIALPSGVNSAPWLQAGFDDVLRMPYDEAELAARLNLLLRDRAVDVGDVERCLHRLLDHVSDAIVLLDAAGRLLYSNPAAERVVNTAAAPPAEAWLLACVHPDDRERLRTMLASLRAEPDGVHRASFRSRRIDGNWASLEIAATNLLHDPWVAAIIATVRDQAERERVEQARAHLAAIVSSSSDAILSKTLDGTITSWNTGATQLYGYTAEEMIGRPTATLILPERALELQHTLDRVRRGERVMPYETERLHKDGRRIAVSVTVSPVVDDEGRVVGASAIARDIGEQHRAQAALRRSEERFRALIERAPDGIALVGEGGRLAYVSPSTERIMGYCPEEIVGRDPADFTHPDDLARLLEVLRELMQEPGAVKTVEYRVAHKDGAWHWIESTISNLLAEPAVGALVFNYRDVSDRRRSEEALREAEGRYRRLVEHIPAIVYSAALDEGGHMLYVSPRIEALLGFSPDEWEAEAKAWLRQLHPWDHDGLLTEVAQAGDDEPVIRSEHHIRTRTGHEAWFSDEAVVVRDDQGKPRFLQGVMIDITRRKQAEAALEANYSLLSAVIESSPDAVYVKDLQGRYLLMNGAGAGMLGLCRDECIGHDAVALLGAEAARPIVEADQRVLTSGELETYEHTATLQGATRVYVSTEAPYRDAQGRIIGLIGISRDVTERKRLEAQFLHAQKMESVGRLAGGIAHDFNNVLMAISGYAEMALLALPESAAPRRDLREIIRAAERAASLTRQLLAFASQQMIEPRVLDLNHLIRDLDRLLRRLLQEDIELSTVLAPDLGPVRADPGQIEQVLVNLAVNARDAMPDGGKLTVETRNVVLDEDDAQARFGVTPGAYALVAVSDTGVGMDQETQRKIFEPFFTTKETGRGTGLGLSTCYGIVRQHGGSIWVYSEPECGTTFKIHLPLVQTPAEPLPQGDEQNELPRGAERVLLVEDDVAVRTLTARLLRDQGYRVIEAGDGEAARQLLLQATTGPIDLVVTDVVLPGMDSQALIAYVGSLYPGVKVLFISGYATGAVSCHGRLVQGAHFLSKPFTRAALAQKVREALDT